MLNFDSERYLRIQRGALALAPQIRSRVAAVLRQGCRNIFFSGTGGAAILMQPAAQLLSRHSRLPVFHDFAAELILSGSKHLDDQSLVVLPSLSGTTQESIAFLEFAKRRGATVMALTAHGDSPIARGADHALVNFAEDDTSSESFYLQSLLIALAVLAERGESDGADALPEDLLRLPEALLAAKQAIEPDAGNIARHLAQDPWHIITGAGNCWPQAFYYSMCILEEMQWIRTRPVHASDFFHGTLELIEKGVSLILLKGEDVCRPLAARVEHFAKNHTDRLLVIDTQSFDLPGIPERARALLSPIILAALLERVNAHLEMIRQHPLTTRRYYRRVNY